MIQADAGARERILQAAAQILSESPDIDKITIRQIAQRANVGIGLLNYHFGSKDNLLGTVVGNIMAQTASAYLEHQAFPELTPLQRLKAMLKELCATAASNPKLAQFLAKQEILRGDTQAPLYLVPVLRELFGQAADTLELRILALQLLQPLQVAAAAPAAFRVYSGIDIYDEAARNKLIDLLVGHLLPGGPAAGKGGDENADCSPAL